MPIQADNFKFVNLPFERGEILFSKGLFDFMDIRKLQDKVKTSSKELTNRYGKGCDKGTTKLCSCCIRKYIVAMLTIYLLFYLSEIQMMRELKKL